MVDLTQEKALQEAEKKGWIARLKEGLKKTSSKIGDGITSILHKRRLDQEMLDDLEELLIQADLGVESASQAVQALAKDRFDKDVSEEEVRTFLAQYLAKDLESVAYPLVPMSQDKPFVVLVVGVNGSGKTTTIGKIAALWARQGLKVRIAAGDTFRAAAVEQLEVWAGRADVPIVRGAQNADPAGLVFEALRVAREKRDDVLLVDTAGRLQNKENLMDELAKIRRVLTKIDPNAPHACLLVLDAGVGQNAHSQVELFQKTAGVTGLVITKLDGTAKGGVIVALTKRFGLPLHMIGVGEGLDDLQPFDAASFAKGLLGIDS
jgi:fused signal recognition particle receptor